MRDDSCYAGHSSSAPYSLVFPKHHSFAYSVATCIIQQEAVAEQSKSLERFAIARYRFKYIRSEIHVCSEEDVAWKCIPMFNLSLLFMSQRVPLRFTIASWIFECKFSVLLVPLFMHARITRERREKFHVAI